MNKQAVIRRRIAPYPAQYHEENDRACRRDGRSARNTYFNRVEIVIERLSLTTNLLPQIPRRTRPVPVTVRLDQKALTLVFLERD